MTAYALRVFILPIIIVIGSFFNLLLFFVMRKVNTTTSLYLRLLAIVDTVVLLTGGLNLWLLSAFNWTIIQQSTMSCKILTFIIYSSFDFSVGLVVLMSADKLYGIVYPLKARSGMLNRNKMITISSLFIFCLIVNIHFLFSYSLIKLKKKSFDNMTILTNNSEQFNSSFIDICTHEMWNQFYSNYWVYIDSTVYSFLPLVLIVGINVSIIVLLAREKKVRLRLSQPDVIVKYSSANPRLMSKILSKEHSDSQSSGYQMTRRLAVVHCKTSCQALLIQLGRRGEKNKINQKHVLAVMFLINISFCLLTMPIVILQIVNKKSLRNKQESDEDFENLFDLLKSIAEILQYINHSIIFFIYCLSGTSYRNKTKIFLAKLFNLRRKSQV